MKTIFILGIVSILLISSVSAFFGEDSTVISMISPIYMGGSSSSNMTNYWNQSAGNLYLSHTANLVGIGVTNPTAPLQIQGDQYIPIVVNTHGLAAGSGGSLGLLTNLLPTAKGQRLGSVSFGSRNAGTTSLYAGGFSMFADGAWTAGASYPSAFSIRTAPNNSITTIERLRIDNNGYIGINSSNPAAQLEITGNGAVNLLNISENQTERMIINTNGYVGLGTNAPAAILHIVNTGSTPIITAEKISSDTLAPQFYYRKARGTSEATKSAILAGDGLFNIGAQGYDGTGYTTSAQLSIRAFAEQNFNTTAKGNYMVFSTTAQNTTTQVFRVYIKGNGNVGIGTATPSQKLDTVGYDNAYGYYTNSTKGITASGTTCTISAIKGGIITGATCV